MEKNTYRQKIFEMFYYIINNRKIDFATFENDYEIKRINRHSNKLRRSDFEIFKYNIGNCIKIFDALKIQYDYIKTSNNENITYDFYFSNFSFEFEYEHLSIDRRRKYGLEIVFLILLKDYPYDYKRAQDIFGEDFTREAFRLLKEELKGCIAGEIIKSDKTKTYHIIDELE